MPGPIMMQQHAGAQLQSELLLESYCCNVNSFLHVAHAAALAAAAAEFTVNYVLSLLSESDSHRDMHVVHVHRDDVHSTTRDCEVTVQQAWAWARPASGPGAGHGAMATCMAMPNGIAYD